MLPVTMSIFLIVTEREVNGKRGVSISGCNEHYRGGLKRILSEIRDDVVSGIMKPLKIIGGAEGAARSKGRANRCYAT